MENVLYGDTDDKQPSPTGSEISYADTSLSNGADEPQRDVGLFSLDSFLCGTRNQGNNGQRVTAESGAPTEQSRQSVLQKNQNRLSINEAQAQSGNQSTPSADRRVPNGSLKGDARNGTSVRQSDGLGEKHKGDHNQGNYGRRSTLDSGASTGQSRQSIIRENPNRMPTDGAKVQSANKSSAEKQPALNTAHRVINRDNVPARKSVDLDDFTHSNRNDGRRNATGAGGSNGQRPQGVLQENANRKPNNGGDQQSVYQPSVNRQPNPNTVHRVANKGDVATHKPTEQDAFTHGNRNDGRRYAPGAGGSAGQPNQGALQEIGNRKPANGAKAMSANKPSANPQPSTSNVFHRSVDARQKPFLAVRDIEQLREEPNRNRSPSQCSTESFQSTVGNKRRQPPADYNAGMALPEERPPQPKKMSPVIRSDAHTNQSARMPSFSDNQAFLRMAAPAQKPSGQKPNPPVFTDKKQPAQIDPKQSTSVEADSDSRKQNANPPMDDKESRSECSDEWSIGNGSAQLELQKNDGANDPFAFESDDQDTAMPQDTGHGSNENPRKLNANDGDGLKKMDGNVEIKKNKNAAANEELEYVAEMHGDFQFDDFGDGSLLPDFNLAEYPTPTDDSFRVDEPFNFENDDELQSPGVRRLLNLFNEAITLLWNCFFSLFAGGHWFRRTPFLINMNIFYISFCELCAHSAESIQTNKISIHLRFYFYFHQFT